MRYFNINREKVKNISVFLLFITFFTVLSLNIGKNRNRITSLFPNENSVYLIENAFYAYFPQKPTLYNQIENKGIEFLFYSYNDFNNSLFFNAAYGIWQSSIKKSQRNIILENLMNGEINSLSGVLLTHNKTNFNGENAIVFSYKYEAGGAKRLKFKIFIQLEKTTCSWSIHGIVGQSEQRAKKIFYKKLNDFKLNQYH
ncbi:MAG: hypothetical protein L3J41_16845 [Melioribacteraceae bacterium]|nr:hypothetical protein [Melioribacteraceae bacterium]